MSKLDSVWNIFPAKLNASENADFPQTYRNKISFFPPSAPLLLQNKDLHAKPSSSPSLVWLPVKVPPAWTFEDVKYLSFLCFCGS